MTISLLSEASGKPNLDLVFDPYVEGTKPPSTGLLDDSGSDIVNRYAPIVYGSQAAATGLLTEQSGNADINTLFAAYGTAVYSLSINNQTYIASGTAGAGQHVSAICQFNISTSGWSVTTVSSGSGTITQASGSTPSGAVSIEITPTWLDSIGDTDPGTVSNTCATYTTIPSSGAVGCAIREAGSTSGQTSYKLVILMKNSIGNIISNTTTYFTCITSQA